MTQHLVITTMIVGSIPTQGNEFYKVMLIYATLDAVSKIVEVNYTVKHCPFALRRYYIS